MAIECSSLNRTYIYHPVQGSGNIIEGAGEEEVYETPSAGLDMAIAIRNSQQLILPTLESVQHPAIHGEGLMEPCPSTREPLAMEGCCVKRVIVV